jgi:hypothetical protein
LDAALQADVELAKMAKYVLERKLKKQGLPVPAAQGDGSLGQRAQVPYTEITKSSRSAGGMIGINGMRFEESTLS